MWKVRFAIHLNLFFIFIFIFKKIVTNNWILNIYISNELFLKLFIYDIVSCHENKRKDLFEFGQLDQFPFFQFPHCVKSQQHTLPLKEQFWTCHHVKIFQVRNFNQFFFWLKLKQFVLSEGKETNEQYLTIWGDNSFFTLDLILIQFILGLIYLSTFFIIAEFLWLIYGSIKVITISFCYIFFF